MITGWHYYIDAVMIVRWRYCLNTVMTTRLQYCLLAAMITRWYYCISVEMVTGFVHWRVNVSNCKELWIAKRKHQHLQTAGKDHILGNGMGYHRMKSETEGQKERERGGRMQCFMKKEYKCSDRCR